MNRPIRTSLSVLARPDQRCDGAPARVFVYATDATWADDARTMLHQVAALVPTTKQVIALANRDHASQPFVDCLTAIVWDYIVRLPDDTLVNATIGWQPVGSLHPRRYPLRRFAEVAVWKTHQVVSNVVVYRYERAGFQPVRWHLLTSLAPAVERCCEYACRWWQECGFKVLKSALFHWERSRVCQWARRSVAARRGLCDLGGMDARSAA